MIGNKGTSKKQKDDKYLLNMKGENKKKGKNVLGYCLAFTLLLLAPWLFYMCVLRFTHFFYFSF